MTAHAAAAYCHRQEVGFSSQVILGRRVGVRKLRAAMG